LRLHTAATLTNLSFQTEPRRRESIKRTLDEVDDSDDGGAAVLELSTLQMLEKYGQEQEDMIYDDPDYMLPDEEPSSEEISSEGEVDSAEELTESSRMLNG